MTDAELEQLITDLAVTEQLLLTLSDMKSDGNIVHSLP